MKKIMESWDKFLKESSVNEIPAGTPEDDITTIDLSEPGLDEGFCEWNPKINAYAQENADQFAETLMFVIASQQMPWHEFLAGCQVMFDWFENEYDFLTPEQKVQKNVPLPTEIRKMFRGRGLHIRKVWHEKRKLFSMFKPLIDEYNDATNVLEQEAAVYNIYRELILNVNGLGLPKAAFASQMIIGRLGCIDTINMKLYKHFLVEFGELIKPKSDSFKSLTIKKDAQGKGFFPPSRKGIIEDGTNFKLTQKYIDFLKELAKLNSASGKHGTQFLWDSWVKIVAARLREQKKYIRVINPDGKESGHRNLYTRKASFERAERLKQQMVGNTYGPDVSSQHYIPILKKLGLAERAEREKLRESKGFKVWSEYFYSLLD
tara:strand:+ start:254 stop:1381 length:1128 start_codon:yes stop_codon:yes gene_type:complete